MLLERLTEVEKDRAILFKMIQIIKNSLFESFLVVRSKREMIFRLIEKPCLAKMNRTSPYEHRRKID